MAAKKKPFSIDTLTLGEVARIEELSGASIAELGEDNTPKGKMLAALVFVAQRRQGNKNFKWADALRTPLEEAQKLMGDAAGDNTDTDTEIEAGSAGTDPKA